jgi:hypothetical protein
MTEITWAVSEAKLAEVEVLAAKLGAAEAQLEHGYGTLAFRLKEISEKRYWEPVYESFGAFLTHLKETHKVGRASLYSYLATARELAGDVTEAQLSEMGISKALVLSAAKNINPILPAEAVTKALDPNVTTKDLKQLLFKANNVLEPEAGNWKCIDAEFYATDEEWEVLTSAANAARHEDPPVSDKLKPSAQIKEILLRLSMNYLADHSGSIVEGGKGW